MLRKRSVSFYYKKSEKNEDDTLRTKAKSQEKTLVAETVGTFPRVNQSHFAGSTPALAQLLGDLVENPIFKQQKQKNTRSKSIDFLTTKPVIPAEVYNGKAGKAQFKHGHQRKSFSANNLTVSFFFIFSLV